MEAFVTSKFASEFLKLCLVKRFSFMNKRMKEIHLSVVNIINNLVGSTSWTRKRKQSHIHILKISKNQKNLSLKEKYISQWGKVCACVLLWKVINEKNKIQLIKVCNVSGNRWNYPMRVSPTCLAMSFTGLCYQFKIYLPVFALMPKT